jgi:hypothetical protein
MAGQHKPNPAHIWRYPLDALHDQAVIVDQDQVGVASHELDDQVDKAEFDFVLLLLRDLVIVARRAEFRWDHGLLIRGENTLGYTDANQPFQRRLVDAGYDAPAHVFAQEQAERGDQRRVQRRHGVCEPEARQGIVSAGQEMATPAASIDFSANRALINETDPLDTAVTDGGVEFINHRGDGQEIIGIWHE